MSAGSTAQRAAQGSLRRHRQSAARTTRHICRTSKFEQGNTYADELRETAKYIATRGKGILASDESNATTGKRLASVGVENTEDNRRAWRQTLYTAPGLGQYISGADSSEALKSLAGAAASRRQGASHASCCAQVNMSITMSRQQSPAASLVGTFCQADTGSSHTNHSSDDKLLCAPITLDAGAIMFEETLYQSTKDGKPFVDVLTEQGIKPGIKVDTGLQMLPGTNGETSTQGLDGLGDRMKAYYQQVCPHA